MLASEEWFCSVLNAGRFVVELDDAFPTAFGSVQLLRTKFCKVLCILDLFSSQERFLNSCQNILKGHKQ